MEEDYVMIPGSGTKMIIRDVKKEIETVADFLIEDAVERLVHRKDFEGSSGGK